MFIAPYNFLGFSQSVNPATLSGPDPLWKDVLRTHKQAPWHVMLGGGDQLYCDGLEKKSALFRAWLNINNLHHKFSTPWTIELRDEVEEFYLEQYCEVSCLHETF
jgi:PhoD related phosphatase